jgi:RNase P/RNase MRP subunit POP5
MAGRERNRYVVCDVMSEAPLGNSCTLDKILFAFRQSVISSFGEVGLGSFGASSKVVISFTEFCGIFIIRVPANYLSEALASLSGMISIHSKAVAVRVLHVSGRLRNSAQAGIDAIINWRNNLPPNYAIPRKTQLDSHVKKAIEALQSLPSYA